MNTLRRGMTPTTCTNVVTVPRPSKSKDTLERMSKIFMEIINLINVTFVTQPSSLNVTYLSINHLYIKPFLIVLLIVLKIQSYTESFLCFRMEAMSDIEIDENCDTSNLQSVNIKISKKDKTLADLHLKKLRKLEVQVLLSLFYLEPSTPMKLQLLLHRLPNPLSRNCGPPPNRRSLPSRAMKSSDCQQKLHSKPRKRIISFDGISCKLSPAFQSKLD